MEIKVTHNDVAHRKLLIVLIGRLLRDGYQNKPFEGLWTPNGTIKTQESLCLSIFFKH